MGCHFLLQGIFLTQGSNPDLPYCRQTLYPLSHQGSRCVSDQRLKILQSLRGRNLSQQVWLSGIPLLRGWRVWAHRSPGSHGTSGERSGPRFSTAVSQTDGDYQEITAPLIVFQFGEVISKAKGLRGLTMPSHSVTSKFSFRFPGLFKKKKKRQSPLRNKVVRGGDHMLQEAS